MVDPQQLHILADEIAREFLDGESALEIESRFSSTLRSMSSEGDLNSDLAAYLGMLIAERIRAHCDVKAKDMAQRILREATYSQNYDDYHIPTPNIQQALDLGSRDQLRDAIEILRQHVRQPGCRIDVYEDSGRNVITAQAVDEGEIFDCTLRATEVLKNFVRRGEVQITHYTNLRGFNNDGVRINARHNTWFIANQQASYDNGKL